MRISCDENLDGSMPIECQPPTPSATPNTSTNFCLAMNQASSPNLTLDDADDETAVTTACLVVEDEGKPEYAVIRWRGVVFERIL